MVLLYLHEIDKNVQKCYSGIINNRKKQQKIYWVA